MEYEVPINNIINDYNNYNIVDNDDVKINNTIYILIIQFIYIIYIITIICLIKRFIKLNIFIVLPVSY